MNAERYCPRCDRSFSAETVRCPDDGTRLVLLAEHDPLVGRELDGRFTVRDRIGGGGMGAVYRAWQHSVGREVAVKVIHPRLLHDRAAAKRFLREATLASRLMHPNVVAVIDCGQTGDGVLYMAMELLRGRTLRALLVDGPLPLARALALARQLCDALEAAHRMAIVHRDLKPANLMVLDEPRDREVLKVLDFGLAKSLADEGSTLTASGLVLGTPSYLAPEAARGGEVDERSDLYALGVILYEMLAGAPPFVGDDARAVAARHATEAPPPLPPTAPPVLAALVMKLLAKDPALRHRSAAQVRQALDAAEERSPGRAPPPAHRRWPRWAALSAAAAALLALLAPSALHRLSATAPRPAAPDPSPAAAPPPARSPDPSPAVLPSTAKAPDPPPVAPPPTARPPDPRSAAAAPAHAAPTPTRAQRRGVRKPAAPTTAPPTTAARPTPTNGEDFMPP